MDKPKLTPNRDIDELLLSECRGQERQVGIYGICTDEKEEEKRKGIKGDYVKVKK